MGFPLKEEYEEYLENEQRAREYDYYSDYDYYYDRYYYYDYCDDYDGCSTFPLNENKNPKSVMFSRNNMNPDGQCQAKMVQKKYDNKHKKLKAKERKVIRKKKKAKRIQKRKELNLYVQKKMYL